MYSNTVSHYFNPEVARVWTGMDMGLLTIYFGGSSQNMCTGFKQRPNLYVLSVGYVPRNVALDSIEQRNLHFIACHNHLKSHGTPEADQPALFFFGVIVTFDWHSFYTLLYRGMLGQVIRIFYAI